MKWINSCTYLDLVRLGPFYREFLVGLLNRCYYHRGRCVGEWNEFQRTHPKSRIVDHGVTVLGLHRIP